MPAPHQPNTTAATTAVVRRGDETAARRLRDHDWIVLPPEAQDDPEFTSDLVEALAIAATACTHPYWPCQQCQTGAVMDALRRYTRQAG